MINFIEFLRLLSEDEVRDATKRSALMSELQTKFPGSFIKTSEEFSKGKIGGIWITGKEMADYYGKDNTGFDYWVSPKLQRVLNKHKFSIEPYDSETWFAFPY